jgi:hypothetical protein
VDAADIVREVLAELGRRVAARDVEGTYALYEPGGVLAGTMGDNVGAEAIHGYVRMAVTADDPLSWEWDDVVAERVGDLVWFFAPGWILFGGRERFRLTGVLRRDGDDWRFAQFHGSVLPS